ncbi:phosphatase PAP2 family protein [Pseudorhodoferax sp.]|uniref:phosphatase PAP2 family protein n=1 Tax=Pseudorhodoferax sp. TaxID=1993553 RepID=UPI0039E2EE93
MGPARSIEKRAPLFGEGNRFAWLLVCLLVAGFALLTSEVREALAGGQEWIGTIDQRLLAFVVEHRTRSFNRIAVDLTALGSGSVLSIVTVLFCAFFLLDGKRLLALHALLAAVGATCLTGALKSGFERSRPDVALRLVDAHGFSYPSGHSLGAAAIYFTCAVLVARQLRGVSSRSAMWVFFSAVVGLVGFSRIYLGVHYFSDVVAGILIGLAWAALLEIAMGHLGGRVRRAAET